MKWLSKLWSWIKTIKYVSNEKGKWFITFVIGKYQVYIDWNMLDVKGLNISIYNYPNKWKLRGEE